MPFTSTLHWRPRIAQIVSHIPIFRFPLTLPTDKEQKIVGFEERGRPQSDGTSYKGKAEGSNSSSGLWIANLSGKSLEHAEKVLWFESAYDAMAYYQLHRQSGADTKAVYVSTGGNPTENQFCGLVSVTPPSQTSPMLR